MIGEYKYMFSERLSLLLEPSKSRFSFIYGILRCFLDLLPLRVLLELRPTFSILCDLTALHEESHDRTSIESFSKGKSTLQ